MVWNTKGLPGHKQSEETRKKISIALKGRRKPPRSERHCKRLSEVKKGNKYSKEHRANISKSVSGENNPFYGKKHTKEVREKISKILTGRKLSEKIRRKLSKAKKGVSQRPEIVLKIFGEGNPNWKGGASFQGYCHVWTDKEFKEDIKKRDGYNCQNPNCLNITNRLCVHHIDYDKKNCHPNNLITLCISCNSRANSNREYWTEYYNSIIFMNRQPEMENSGIKKLNKVCRGKEVLAYREKRTSY